MGKKSAKKRQGKPQQSLRQSPENTVSFRQIPSGYIVIVLIVLGFAIYSNTFNSPFHFDDSHAIVDNSAIRDIKNISAIWNIQPTRFLTFYTFSLNYHFHGLEVWGYHLVNIIVHISASILVYLFILLTFRSPYLKDHSLAKHRRLIAAFAALLFLVHPVQTQAVTYIVQRLASLATLFYVASLTCYAKARLTENSPAKKICWYVLFGAIAITSFFTKETSFTLPLMLLLYEITFFQQRPVLNWKTVGISFVFMGIIASVLLYMKPDFGGLSLHKTTGGIIELSRSQYMITSLRVMMTYIRLAVFPVNQNLDYDYPIFDTVFNAQILLSIAVLVAVFVGALMMYQKNRLFSFGVLWAFIVLLPESSIIPISDVIFEHRMYLPMAGVCTAFASLLFYLVPGKLPLRLVISVLILCILSFSVATYKRNSVWSSALRLWDDTVQKSPEKARPRFYRANALLAEGRFEEAVRDYSAAIEINPYHRDAYNNRGKAFFETGEHEKAYYDFSMEINLNPGEWIGFFNRGKVLKAEAQHERAISDLKKSAEIKPRAETFYYIGLCSAKLGWHTEAVDYFSKAVQRKDLNEAVYYNRGLSYAHQGETEKAMADFTKAIEINQQYDSAYYNRGLLHHRAGRMDEAIGDYSQTLRINPQHIPALNNRGLLYLSTGQVYEALLDFENALELNPECAECYYNLSIFYNVIHEPEQAAAALKQAQALGYGGAAVKDEE